MAANKFATMLHRNTNKITMILIYAVLEWILIGLLLINSLFSYLIIKFADYVGLKPPCLWCSRIDHILDPKKKKNMHKDLLCEAHAKEVSLLGYCLNHQKLTESQDLCVDCLSSKPEFGEVSKDIGFFGMIQTNGEEKVVENGLDIYCSCCCVNFERNMVGPQIVIKPSWDVLEYSKKDDDDDQVEKGVHFYDENRSDEIEKMVSYVNEVLHSLKEDIEDEGKEEENEEGMILKKDQGVQVGLDVEDDASLELLSQHLEFFIDYSGHRLVPVELIDSATEEDFKKVVEQEAKDEDYGSSDIEEEKEDDVEQSVNNNGELNFVGLLDSMEMEEHDNSLVFYAKECSEKREEVDDPPSQFNQSSIQEFESDVVVQGLEAGEEEEKLHSDVHSVHEDAGLMHMNQNDGLIHMNQNEIDADVSIETEINDLNHVTDEVTQTDNMEEEEEAHTEESPSTSSVNLEACIYGSSPNKEQTMEFNSLSIEMNDHVIRTRSLSLELSEIEEGKVPDTPTSVDGLHHLHKKLLLLEKMDSGTEDSLDGSVTSDLEHIVSDGGVITSEQLKSVIKAERKALHALYSELEEERNASEIAANQTMAMINRLQEEKAAMQMEALQYQRMMEEQAEYDQEALQLLNELMVKREKEKEELEKELDVCRKKVLEYETKERLRMLRRMNSHSSGRSGLSSPSCSNAEENDTTSFDLSQEVKDLENGFYSHGHRDSDNENTPVNTVLNLEDSIADFEGERKSILEHLKVLEEKLMTIDDDEEEYLHHLEDIASPTKHHEETNGNHVLHENGLENGHATNAILTRENVNGKYHPLKSDINGPMGKNLLPLFDATRNGNGFHGSNNGLDRTHSFPTYEERSKRRFAVQEELDDLYERLQALEEDREFLKHCISSINKGDKGMHLLHEILHHLKDLRNVDLHVRNLSDSGIK